MLHPQQSKSIFTRLKAVVSLEIWRSRSSKVLRLGFLAPKPMPGSQTCSIPGGFLALNLVPLWSMSFKVTTLLSLVAHFSSRPQIGLSQFWPIWAQKTASPSLVHLELRPIFGQGHTSAFPTLVHVQSRCLTLWKPQVGTIRGWGGSLGRVPFP